MSLNNKTAFFATKILLPIDFEPFSEAALEAASGLAKQFHAGIHLVHIIAEIPDVTGADFFPDTVMLQEQRQAVEQKLKTCQEQLQRQSIPASFSIETGNDVVGNLMRVLKREQADMIVISTHGLRGWRPFIMGSIAEQIIKQSNCTLLLLHTGATSAPAAEPAIECWEDTFTAPVVTANAVNATGIATETSAQRRLDYSAEKLAERGARAEQKYDAAHSLFTK